MMTKAKVTKDGLLIPREVAERALGEGSEEVEIFEEPGRLLISPARVLGSEGGDPILAMGEDPMDDRVTDGSSTATSTGVAEGYAGSPAGPREVCSIPIDTRASIHARFRVPTSRRAFPKGG